MTNNSRIPQAIQDKITGLEAQIAMRQEEIARFGATINGLQERILNECRLQDADQNQIDLLRFAVQAYEEEPPEPPVEQPGHEQRHLYGMVDPEGEGEAEDWGGGGDTSDGWRARDTAKPAEPPAPPSIKDRVYSVMAWRHGPVMASDIAKELGMSDTRSVAPILGRLHKEKKIKPAPQGGWVRTHTAGLGMVMQED